ncbi:hypothetical protein ACKXGF_02135 [Alkalibacillus sp. S2W]|uniref:hypothetical protein n=1 Tax=Alkalibacillus sp. S2W TaxID=3386553 RepID=UPI00398CEC1E
MHKLHNISSRMATAFLTMALTYIAYLLYSGFRLSEAYDLVSNPFVWLIFIVYLVICSYVNEWAVRKLDDDSKRTFVSLYMLSAMFIWVLVYIPLAMSSMAAYLYMIFYSSLFTVFAFLLFYFIERIVRRSKRRPFGVGVPAIIILIIIMIWNPAIKSGFSETYDEGQYEVTFDQFNGEETVHIPVESGQNYEVRVEWDLVDDSGNNYGLKRHSATSNYGNLDYIGEDEDWLYQFESSESGDLPIKYHGHNISGSIVITWKNVSDN